MNTPNTPKAIDTPRLSSNDIQELLSYGQKDFTRTNWMGIDFSTIPWTVKGINLTEACLIGITARELTNCNLTRANVRNANFVTAYLDNTNFTGANLDGANFRGAHLRGVNFAYTILNNVNLAFADLRDAKHIDFPLYGRGNSRSNILLWQTIFPDGTLFPGPYLTTGYGSDLLREYE